MSLLICSPLSSVHTDNCIGSPPRSIWRGQDSSEKTLSNITGSGDGDEAYIFPALVAVASLSPPPTVASVVVGRPIPHAVPLCPPRPSGEARGGEDDGGGEVQSRLHHAPGDRLEWPATGPTVLAPLEPLYSPPHRSPTPDGLPSYEASQRRAEARLARRVLESRLGIYPGSAGASGGAGRP